MVFGVFDGKLYFYDLVNYKMIHETEAYSGQIKSVAISPINDLVAFATYSR